MPTAAAPISAPAGACDLEQEAANASASASDRIADRLMGGLLNSGTWISA
jgi:hypothetical protein